MKIIENALMYIRLTFLAAATAISTSALSPS